MSKHGNLAHPPYLARQASGRREFRLRSNLMVENLEVESQGSSACRRDATILKGASKKSIIDAMRSLFPSTRKPSLATCPSQCNNAAGVLPAAASDSKEGSMEPANSRCFSQVLRCRSKGSSGKAGLGLCLHSNK